MTIQENPILPYTPHHYLNSHMNSNNHSRPTTSLIGKTKSFQHSPRYKPPLFRLVLRPITPFTFPNSILCSDERAPYLTYSRADSRTECTVLEWRNTFRYVGFSRI